MAVAKFDEGEKGTTSIGTPRGQQEMITVSEPGLYRLIMRSRTSEGRSSGVQGRVASHAFLSGSFFPKAEG
jgi:hypothetical protein